LSELWILSVGVEGNLRLSRIDSAFSVTDPSVVLEARLMSASGCSRLLITECHLSDKAMKDII
jgi:hypothetical protein